MLLTKRNNFIALAVIRFYQIYARIQRLIGKMKNYILIVTVKTTTVGFICKN